MLEDTETDGKF